VSKQLQTERFVIFNFYKFDQPKDHKTSGKHSALKGTKTTAHSTMQGDSIAIRSSIQVFVCLATVQ
jgi:hypothetical protein